MKPSVDIQQLIEDMNNKAKMLGLDVLSEKLKIVLRTFMTACAPVSFTIFGLHWAVLETRRHWMDGLKCFIMFGALVNGIFKLIILIHRRSAIRDLLLHITNSFAQSEESGTLYCEALYKGVNRFVKIRRFIRMGYLITYLVILVIPLVSLFQSGKRTTIMQYEIPGLDIETNLGFALTYIQHLLPIVVGGIGFFAGDMLVLIPLVQIRTFADILQIKADELNVALNRKEQSRYLKRVGESMDCGVEALFIEMLKYHQFFTDYCRTVEEIFHILLATQVLSASVGILVCFCVSLASFHLISAIFLLFSAYSMIIYCMVGTQVDYAYDLVYDTLCNLNWQELNIDQRKKFLLMLLEAQNTKIMNLLGILPLSLGTALQLSKLIYSISMMMMRSPQ